MFAAAKQSRRHIGNRRAGRIWHTMAHFGTRKGDAELILALAGGSTVRQAAKRAKVSERTAHRRLNDRDYRRRIDAARAEMISQATGQLAKAATDATTTLSKLLKSESDAIRLGACRTILENCERLRQGVELSQRMTELERLHDELVAKTHKTGSGHQPANNGRHARRG